jgi:hypothetical protein
VAAATRDIGGRRREPVLGAVAGHPPRDRPPEAPGDAADGALNVLVGIESKALGLDPARNRQGDNVEGAAAGAAMSTPSSPGPARPVSGRPCAGRTGRAVRQWRAASGWRWPPWPDMNAHAAAGMREGRRRPSPCGSSRGYPTGHRKGMMLRRQSVRRFNGERGISDRGPG